ncbi:right-handed parallel beta-helix repeat-containing protein [Candidatus Acetothermia bacterium]|nr:right-handed parallel beta-helix repeat-containing protein [Candidatus Acetothermia bacterium]MBI3643404.1 right-handed parallel beta-helix repeat-containing protein [Candidatus Acetothermia bacterium]
MEKRFAKKAIFFLILGLLSLGFSSAVDNVARGGSLITVCPSGPPACDTASVQEAVAKAAPGSTLFIAAGSYAGPVIIANSVTLIGAGQEQTVITRGVIVVGPFGVTLKALKVTAGLNGVQGQAPPGLPEQYSPSLSLQSVTITGNAANGVALFNYSKATLQDVQINTNGITIQGNPVGSGIAVRGHAKVTIKGTSIIQKSGANGISASDNASVTIGGSTLIQMNQLSGIQLGGSSTASITELTAQANACYGLDVTDNSTANVNGGTYQGNAKAGIHVGGPSSILLGCGTNTDSVLSATANLSNVVIAGNKIGLLVGDLSKDLEQATVTGIGVIFLGNGVNMLVDPVDTKNVEMH